MISSKNLADSIYKLSKDSSLKKEDVLNTILDYINIHKLEPLLSQTVRYLEMKEKKELIWDTLNIESGLTIDDFIVKDIKERLNATQTGKVSIVINKELIGGFKAIYRGVIYDASIKNQLQLLRNALTK